MFTGPLSHAVHWRQFLNAGPSFIFALKAGNARSMWESTKVPLQLSLWPLILPCARLSHDQHLKKASQVGHHSSHVGRIDAILLRLRSCTGPSGTWSNTSQIPQLGSFSLRGCLDELPFFLKHVPNSSPFLMPLFKKESACIACMPRRRFPSTLLMICRN